MKKIIYFIVTAVALSSCTVTLPLQSNLSDQTMLLAENRNVKANYTLVSNVPDGFISYVSAQKDGTETINNKTYIYASESAFKKIWSSYFSNKFNTYSKEQMDIEITLKDLKIREQFTTSIGMIALTGTTEVNVDAIATIHVLVDYHGKKYENQFEVDASDYNKSQQRGSGYYAYTTNQTNPTQQKAMLLESCLNKSVIQFENFLRSVMLAAKESE